MERARGVLPVAGVAYLSSTYGAATGADAQLILTDWEEFATLDLERLRSALAYPIMVDSRNLDDPATMSAAGFIYCSIGRPDVVLQQGTPASGRTAAKASRDY